jgi:hypothetical protein
MPDLTLNEYAKSLPTSDAQRPVIEMFAASADYYGAIKFRGLDGRPVYEGWRQSSHPTLAFRGANETSSSGAGKLTPFQEASFRMDHDIDIDMMITDRMGDENWARHEQLGIAGAGRLWADTFIGGDNADDPREFNGLQARSALYSRTTANSAASGGAALSLLKLDQAINAVSRPSHIIVPFDSKPLWIGAARNTSLSGFVIQSWDQVGTPKMSYGGLPLLFGYPKDDHTPVLRFNETGSGGGDAVTASLYVCSFTEEGLFGIQIKALSAVGPNVLENQITKRTHISWDVGLVDAHKYCFHRLTSWTNAAIVA